VRRLGRTWLPQSGDCRPSAILDGVDRVEQFRRSDPTPLRGIWFIRPHLSFVRGEITAFLPTTPENVNVNFQPPAILFCSGIKTS
jgi:hypothetical protein